MALFPMSLAALDACAPSPVARAAQGDRGALRDLYVAHAPAVRRFLRGMLGCPAAADDGTQETFVRAFRRLSTLRDEDRLMPWLFGIARLVAMEARRARRRDGSLDPAKAEVGGGDSPEATLLGEEVARLASRAMASLPEDRRAALLLRVDHDVPYEEIGRILGWSTAKAKIEVHRARLVLRDVLGRGGER